MLLGPLAHGQDADAQLGSPGGWQRYNWLAPAETTTAGTGSEGKVTTTAGQSVGDPFAVVGGDSLWREDYDVIYARPLAPGLNLTYDTSAVALNEDSSAFAAATDGTPDDLTHSQKASLQLQPAPALTLTGNVHDAMDDAGSPEDSVEKRGDGFTAEGRLPFQSTLTLNANSDTTSTGLLNNATTADDAYDAQLKQPLGKLPLTAVLKGHYEETTTAGAPATRLPSLEQSLVWKAGTATTVQAGLRQQQYENFPGVTNVLNEAVFADWSQSLLPAVTWHSYAEVLDIRGTEDLAPAAPATSGANGTPQSNDPTNTLALPTSFSDETLTFSTGPSFKLDQGVSASIEYSNRIDRNPLPGDVGQEQRVSVSLKGTF
jgi:hypothetical protein